MWKDSTLHHVITDEFLISHTSSVTASKSLKTAQISTIDCRFTWPTTTVNNDKNNCGNSFKSKHIVMVDVD